MKQAESCDAGGYFVMNFLSLSSQRLTRIPMRFLQEVGSTEMWRIHVEWMFLANS